MVDKFVRLQTIKPNNNCTLCRILADTFNRQLDVGVGCKLSVADTDIDNVITDVETLHSAHCAIQHVDVKQTAILISHYRKEEPIGCIVVKSVDATDDATREDVVSSDRDGGRQWCDDRRRTASFHNQHGHVHIGVERRHSVIEHTHRQMVLVLHQIHLSVKLPRWAQHASVVDVEVAAAACNDVVGERRSIRVEISISYAQTKHTRPQIGVRLHINTNHISQLH